MAPLGFVEELCIALEHRWVPEEFFVIFTANFDEADTHGESPTVILAAFLGHAYQWRRFETKLGRIQQRDQFTIFHGKEFKAKSGEFAGWDDQKCMRLVTDLTELVKNNLTEGLVIHLERERFLNEYRAPPIPKKMNLDSQYGVCFRACLGHLLGMMQARGNRDRLNVVIERGHKNVWDCERIFNQVKTVLRRLGIDVLGTFTVGAKDTCPPLMLADFLAGTYSMMRAARGGVSVQTYQDIAPMPAKREAGLTFLELLPDALTKLKTDFERLRQHEVEEWRARKEARKAALASSAVRAALASPPRLVVASGGRAS